MAKNVHKVTKKQWTKFGKIGQATFNRLWCDISGEPEWNNFAKRDRKTADVLRWNTCFMAACNAKDLMNEI